MTKKRGAMLRPNYDIRPLAAAVILQAAREAEANPEAREWLIIDAPLWFAAIGFDIHPDRIESWMRNGYRIRARGALQLGAR